MEGVGSPHQEVTWSKAPKQIQSEACGIGGPGRERGHNEAPGRSCTVSSSLNDKEACVAGAEWGGRAEEDQGHRLERSMQVTSSE